MVPEVAITFPDGRTEIVQPQKNRWSVGRSAENDLGYPDDSGLSRHHFILERVGDEWAVRDLGSKNGTFLNNNRVTERQRLRPGDRITASQLVLIYQSPALKVPQVSVVFDSSQEDLLAAKTLSTSLDRLISNQTQVIKPVREPSAKQWTTPLTAFLRAGRELSLGRPLPELFRVILDLSIEAVGAERGVLLTLEGEQLAVQASRGDGFRISTTVRDRVLREKTSLLLRNVQGDEALRSMQSIVSQNVRTLMAVPLQTDDRVIGLIYIDSSHLLREFTRDDLDLLTAMANVAAIRIERERMVEIEHARRRLADELNQAAEIQRGFLPTSAPVVEGLELAGYNVSCRTVGGDYYDFMTYPDGRVAVMVGDVCGKGMPAALLMMSLQARVQVVAEDPSSPAGVVERLNRILTAASLRGVFISFFFSVINPTTGEVVYCNAGHNPPVLVRADGQILRLDGGGPVLGVLPGVTYEQQHCRLNRGDVLVLFSDGVTEATNPTEEMLGEPEFIQILQKVRHEPANVILNRLTQAVQQWMNGAPAADDVTLVVASKT